MRPKIELLSLDLIAQVLDEAFQLLLDPGIKVQSTEARQLLAEAGADFQGEIAHIPEKVIRQALVTAPEHFTLYDREGMPRVEYGGDIVHFDPGSSGVHILDPVTLEHKSSQSQDLLRIVKIAEMLPEYDAQSTALVCGDVPKDIGDLFRLYVVLLFSKKPIVTGSFALATLEVMIDMLAIFAGSRAELAKKPQAIFDVCPTPPLIWSEFGAGDLIALARAGVPAELISMPLAGAASPVTLLGSIVQHAAETLSGIAIHQLANPGAPVVWGGAPAIFDMRKGTTPMGAIETAMIDAAYAQVGKSLNLPTHAYLGASDAKVVDAQAGLESGITSIIGALAGINMISGAGMLDFLACQSAEKLIIDAEGIAMAKRLIKGIQVQSDPIATEFFKGINFKGEFLKQKITRELFKVEQYLPSPVIDRSTHRSWIEAGRLDAFSRARIRANELLDAYQKPFIESNLERELNQMVSALAQKSGMGQLPILR